MLKKTAFRIDRFLQSRRLREVLIQIASGILTGILFTFATSWRPTWRGWRASDQLKTLFPDTLPDDPVAVAMVLFFGYYVGVSLGIIGAGRLMVGHFGSWRRTILVTFAA